MDSSSTTSSTKKYPHHHRPPLLTCETSATTNTTFVHAHPSNFRAVVQHLTGSSSSSSPANHRTPPLHERRERAAMRKLEMNMIKLSTSSQNYHYNNNGHGMGMGMGLGLGLVSPVSTLDGPSQGGLMSPRTPTSANYKPMTSEDEERAVIAEKGFYLHPMNNTVSSNSDAEPPQLLHLFPLHSPSSTSDHHRP